VGLELADRLGVEAEVFPGGHGGHGDPAFASRLREVLER
jgi:hypothetical protein